MTAREFLKTIILIIGLGFAFYLGFSLVAFLMGYYDIPLTEWTLARVSSIIYWLILIILGVLVGLLAILLVVYRAVDKRDQPKKASIPKF